MDAQYDPSAYGNRWADEYDRLFLPAPDYTEAAVNFLGALAGSGPVLELGVGTGRIAIPLSERGLEVYAIDASPRMVDVLRGKLGGSDIKVTMGDLVDALDAVSEPKFSLIFCVFNTFYLLKDQEHQVRCFRAVSKRLARGGSFVVEVQNPYSPSLTGEGAKVVRVTGDSAWVSLKQSDLVNQRANHVELFVYPTVGMRFFPATFRWAWPTELDLMAALADMTLVERWGGWEKSTYSATSIGNLSVYRRKG